MIPPTLFRYLILNRQQTRAGKATWLYLGLWVTFIVLNQVIVHSIHAVSVEAMGPAYVVFVLASPIILLLNRLDTSGPTRAEVDEAIRAATVQAEAARLIGMKRSLSWKAGRLVRRLLRLRRECSSCQGHYLLRDTPVLIAFTASISLLVTFQTANLKRSFERS